MNNKIYCFSSYILWEQSRQGSRSSWKFLNGFHCMWPTVLELFVSEAISLAPWQLSFTYSSCKGIYNMQCSKWSLTRGWSNQSTVVPATRDPLMRDRLVLCDRPLSAPNSIFCTFCTPIWDHTPMRDHPVTAEGMVFRRRVHVVFLGGVGNQLNIVVFSFLPCDLFHLIFAI